MSSSSRSLSDLSPNSGLYTYYAFGESIEYNQNGEPLNFVGKNPLQTIVKATPRVENIKEKLLKTSTKQVLEEHREAKLYQEALKIQVEIDAENALLFAVIDEILQKIKTSNVKGQAQAIFNEVINNKKWQQYQVNNVAEVLSRVTPAVIWEISARQGTAASIRPSSLAGNSAEGRELVISYLLSRKIVFINSTVMICVDPQWDKELSGLPEEERKKILAIAVQIAARNVDNFSGDGLYRSLYLTRIMQNGPNYSVWYAETSEGVPHIERTVVSNRALIHNKGCLYAIATRDKKGVHSATFESSDPLEEKTPLSSLYHLSTISGWNTSLFDKIEHKMLQVLEQSNSLLDRMGNVIKDQNEARELHYAISETERANAHFSLLNNVDDEKELNHEIKECDNTIQTQLDELNKVLAKLKDLEKNLEVALYKRIQENSTQAALVKEVIESSQALRSEVQKKKDEINKIISVFGEKVSRYYQEYQTHLHSDSSMFATNLAMILNEAIEEFAKHALKGLTGDARNAAIERLAEKYAIVPVVDGQGSTDEIVQRNLSNQSRNHLLEKINMIFETFEKNDPFVKLLRSKFLAEEKRDKKVKVDKSNIFILGKEKVKENGKDIEKDVLVVNGLALGQVFQESYAERVASERRILLKEVIKAKPFQTKFEACQKKIKAIDDMIEKERDIMQNLQASQENIKKFISALQKEIEQVEQQLSLASQEYLHYKDDKDLALPLTTSLAQFSDGIRQEIKALNLALDEIQKSMRTLTTSSPENAINITLGEINATRQSMDEKISDLRMRRIQLAQVNEALMQHKQSLFAAIYQLIEKMTVGGAYFWEKRGLKIKHVGGVTVTIDKIDHKVPERVAHIIQHLQKLIPSANQTPEMKLTSLLKTIHEGEDEKKEDGQPKHRSTSASLTQKMSDVVRTKKNIRFMTILEKLEINMSDPEKVKEALVQLQAFQSDYEESLNKKKLRGSTSGRESPPSDGSASPSEHSPKHSPQFSPQQLPARRPSSPHFHPVPTVAAGSDSKGEYSPELKAVHDDIYQKIKCLLLDHLPFWVKRIKHYQTVNRGKGKTTKYQDKDYRIPDHVYDMVVYLQKYLKKDGGNLSELLEKFPKENTWKDDSSMTDKLIEFYNVILGVKVGLSDIIAMKSSQKSLEAYYTHHSEKYLIPLQTDPKAKITTFDKKASHTTSPVLGSRKES